MRRMSGSSVASLALRSISFRSGCAPVVTVKRSSATRTATATTRRHTPPLLLQSQNNNNNNNSTSKSANILVARSSVRHCFQSSYVNLGANDVTDMLQRHSIEYRDKGLNIEVKECPSCKDTKGDPTNQYKLSIRRDKGVFHCFRCGVKGHWMDLKKMIAGFDLAPMGMAPAENPSAGPIDTTDLGLVSINSKKKTAVELQGFLKTRGITRKTAEAFGVTAATHRFPNDDVLSDGGGYEEHPCIAFPWYDETGAQVRVKYRSIVDKKHMKILPKGGKFGLFGYNLISPTDTEVVITEGEFDAMAVTQATGRKALSLPNGARSLPPAVLPMLEQFSKVYLWLDDDKVGREGVAMCLSKLGVNRCYIVKTRDGAAIGPKDANDVLLKRAEDLEVLIKRAKVVNEDTVLSISELRSGILEHLNDPMNGVGVPFLSMPNLTKILKGHRRGELTIVTGRTGMGKTTLLSQLSLDLAKQGVATLWGSFEIPNIILASKMMVQFANGPVQPEAREQVYDRFEELPIHFLKFWSNTDVARVIEAMDYAVYKHDIEHVVIDNLQFMVGSTFGIDKFDKQDDAVSKFREFATKKHVHVSLVVHPRKEDESTYLTTSSVFGSAKATQEADNVIIIQTEPKNIEQRYIDVRKNRFDGMLGKVEYIFKRDSCLCIEQPHQSKK